MIEWLIEPVTEPRWMDILPWFLIGVGYSLGMMAGSR